MPGWIKLHRKLKENGHLRMPAAAFKLWIYLLLEAAPYPVPERGLKAGEAWVRYRELQEHIGEAGRRASMSTVSGALKYLEQNGYIAVEPVKFKGTRVAVKKWAQYQSAPGASTPGPSPQPGRPNAGHQPACPPAACAGPAADKTSSPATLEEAARFSPGSRPATPQVAENSSPAGGGAAWGGRENIMENYYDNTSLYNTTSANNSNNSLWAASQSLNGPAGHAEPAGPAGPAEPVEGAVCAVCEGSVRARFEAEFGRRLTPLEAEQLARWCREFPAGLVEEALARAALRSARTLAYVGGILANWKREGVKDAAAARARGRIKRAGDGGPRQRPRPSPGPVGTAGAAGESAAEIREKKKAFIRSLYV